MPTYGYCCRACGHKFEEFQSILAAPIKVCPKCKKRKVERELSTGGAVIFKGGGFYETDYRSADYEKAKKADAKAAETKTDSKVETKPESKSDASTPGKAPAKSDAKPAVKGEAKTEIKPNASDPPKNSAKERAPSEEPPRKSHAREGRGIGNILQTGRAKKTAKKTATPARKHK